MAPNLTSSCLRVLRKVSAITGYAKHTILVHIYYHDIGHGMLTSRMRFLGLATYDEALLSHPVMDKRDE
ncbi:hypothetical protein M0804_008980 [Polistes exclamans]|nr:hypothetical protein M0804_008980 [Polistes exclamans]